MMTPPTLNNAQTAQDRDHLQLLAIFYFITAFFALMGMAFLVVHFLVMSAIFNNPEIFKNAHNDGPPPQVIFEFMIWIYFALGLIMVIAGVLNLASGFCLLKRKFRTFSFVVAGLNCLQIPFGTVLGVLTIVVLLRDSVRQMYAPDTR